MLWVFVALVVLEAGVVALVVASRWPRLHWILLALSLATIAWLVSWIRSFKRLPHRIEDDELVLSFGSLRQIRLPIASIKSVRGNFSGDEIKAVDAWNFVPMAYPNRVIAIDPPYSGRRGPIRTFAIRLDEPENFDRALRDRGVGN